MSDPTAIAATSSGLPPTLDLDCLAQAQQQLIDAGRTLDAAGQVPATGGNFSCRLSETLMAVTASGCHKGRLTSGDILVSDFSVKLLGTSRKASDEARLHGQLYEDLPEAHAILHAHSRAATVLSLCHGGDTLSLEGFELNKALEGVKTHETPVRLAVFDNTQDIAALALDVRARLNADANLHGYLIRGHGLYTWASNMTACRRHIEALDFLMSCELELRRQR
ncbi:methylthioribulose 1-phosphate dehydratase [Cobetia sp. L2A1]|uniref:methylthioribulose 1-phosphate dehydratase n=1 Tax=Cobetia sp. L2A1 TaxID=2686360 RepID=UPI00131E7D3B|nr:methylthioribulose 1-phosphate dehydratase [Cobetia sp. L2A1]